LRPWANIWAWPDPDVLLAAVPSERTGKAARAWSGRGYAKLLAGKLDNAARDFNFALTLDTTDAYRAAIWFNFGQVAEKQKKLKQARRAYRTANQLRPSKAAKKALDSVTKRLAK
jgi:tetratricopeptide (TPR) repeat protein